ncbi:hypothetical protein D9M70_476170 [compost metagenome]
MLGVGFGIEVVPLDQLLADVAAAAFGEQGVLGAQLHARGVIAILRIAFTVDTQVAGDDAADHAVLVDQRFLGGEARVDLDAQAFGLLGQPAAQVAQGDDVVAFVVHGLGYEEVRYLDRAFGALQQIDVVTLHRGVQRRFQFLPVGEQFVQRTRLEDSTGENVSTDFGTLLDHADTDLLTSFGGFLFQSACGGQPGGAGADDDDVEFHVLAFHYQSLLTQASTAFCWLWGQGTTTRKERGRIISGSIVISRPLSRNTNVCLNWPEPRWHRASGRYQGIQTY